MGHIVSRPGPAQPSPAPFCIQRLSLSLRRPPIYVQTENQQAANFRAREETILSSISSAQLNNCHRPSSIISKFVEHQLPNFNCKSMEQRDLKQCERDALDSKSQNVLPGAEKSSSASPIPAERQASVGRQHLKSNFASVTPEKYNETSHAKCYKEAGRLPEKYRTPLEYLDSMTCSVRLLHLCKKCPTFQNICSQVEILTRRKFEYKHLAQIKYVLPEAVQIDKISVHDKETMCIKPDIQVTLLFDIVEGHQEESVYIALCHLFASRLRNFLNRHPEACDIPEAVLPEPFNQGDTTIKADPWPVGVITSIESETVKSSHFCPSFSRRLSERAIVEETEKTRLIASPFSYSSVNCDSVTEQQIERQRTFPDSCSKPKINSNSANDTPLYASTRESTPMKVVSESDNLMLETPAQSTPKRSLSTCNGKHKTMINQVCMSCNQTAKRSLDFSRLDDEESSLNLMLYEIEQSKTLPNTSAQMELKGISVTSEGTGTFTTPSEEKTSNCCSEKGHMSYQSCLTAYQQTSVCLSDLVVSIQHIFQSVNSHSMTKEELVHKIIMNNCDIDENSNIKEQLELLETLVPDWICKKLAPSGDVLYNIKKVPDLNSVCQRVTSI